MDERHRLSDAFIDWFGSRPEAKPGLQGKARPDNRLRADPKPTQSAHVEPQITGLTPASRKPDPEELWARMIAMEQSHRSKATARYSQVIEIPDNRPVLLVLLSDLHLGNAYCSYSQAKQDAELVRSTPGVYGAVLGDVIDNWIGEPKIEGVQRQQPIPHAEELALLTSWLGILAPKLVACVAGNHEARSYDKAGVDLLLEALQGVKTLYDQHEIQFTLKLATAEWRWKLRHAWAHKSQYNPTQGQEWDQKFNDGTWQFGVGGHWHGPTAFRDFYDVVHDHERKLAVQLGSYEYDSAYARKLNLSHSPCGGSGGVMLWPDGSWQAWHDLEAATRFLAMERAR